MKTFIYTLFIFFISHMSFAIGGDAQNITGHVKAINEKTILIESGSQIVEIPKKFYNHKVKVGEKIYVEVSAADYANLKTEKKKKK